MRCLSVQQPHAWSICAGLQDIENRSWTTSDRGRIAIHASREQKNWRALTAAYPHLKTHSPLMHYSAIIGVADIVDIQPLSQHLEGNPWAQGPYCWQLDNARMIQRPIPIKGKLNLYDLDPEIEQQLDCQLKLPPLHVGPHTVEMLEEYLVDCVSDQRDHQLNSYEQLGNTHGAARLRSPGGPRLFRQFYKTHSGFVGSS
jgi:hypothetical protein